jgi:hypothetical protein
MSNDTHTGSVVTTDNSKDPTTGSSGKVKRTGKVEVSKLEGVWNVSAFVDGTKVAHYSKIANAWIPTEAQVTFLPNPEFVKLNEVPFDQGTASIINRLPSLSDQKDIVNTAFSTGVFLGPTIGQDPAAGSEVNGEGNEAATQSASPAEPQATDGGPLRYPLLNDDSVASYDYLRIENFEYKAPLSLSLDRLSPESVENRITVSKGVVYLPMHPGISESNSVDWKDDSANAAQIVLGKAAMGLIDGLSDLKPGEAANRFVSELVNGGMAAAGDRSIIPYLTAYFAQQQLGTNLTGRTTGQVLNPNLELLFTGPKLRTFKYNFKMTPRSDDEARMIKRIILFFKIGMAARKSDSNLFLETPDAFRLKYIFSGDTNQQHPFLNKIKACALTNFSVNYTPDNTYMTYNDGSMTSYNLSLSFSELEPIYAGDNEEEAKTLLTTGF